MKAARLKLLIFFLCFSATFACGQTLKGKISGTVWDIAQKPVSGASVRLFNLNDSSNVKTTLVEADGSFTFGNLQNSTYRICITFIGYKEFCNPHIIISQQEPLNLPQVVLVIDSAILKQVNVTAKKPYIEEKIDRTIVNVGALISNTGNNALEVLEKAPGVHVNADGNITFKGKSGVLIMIDNKPTYLSGTNLVTYLRSLPSSSLDQIELMDNPPAKYDAAGDAGVINIKIKKNVIKGFNALFAASYSQGFYARTNESINLNYRINKINLFAIASFNYNRNFRTLEIDRNYLDLNGNINSAFKDLSYFRPTNNNTNLKFGIDYYQTSKTTLGIVFNGGFSYAHDNSPAFGSLYTKDNQLDSTLTTFSTSKNKFNNGGINLNYTHQFNNTGTELSFDFDYIKNVISRDQTLLNNSYNLNSILLSTQTSINNLPGIINIYSAKTDLTIPLKDKAKFDIGLKSSYVTTDNAANYFAVINNMSTIDYNFTNNFLYKENINAVYTNLNKSFKRLELQTGLRLENTNGIGHQLGNVQKPDSSFINHYTNIFPTAYFSFKLDTAGRNLLTLAYGRRIGRPNYVALNPFTTIIDKYTYFAGNPLLKPQFTDNYKLAYGFRNLFTVALIYNYTKDGQNETIHKNGNIFVSTTANIGQRKNLNLSINTNFRPVKWWSLNFYAEAFNNTYTGPLYGGYLNQSANSFSFNSNNLFTIGNDWQAELGGFYNSRQVIGQFTALPSGVINIGLQKKVMENRGTVRMNIRDIFHTNTANGTITNIPNTTASYENFVDSRVATIGFTYNFGKPLVNQRKRVTGSAEGEQNRAKN